MVKTPTRIASVVARSKSNVSFSFVSIPGVSAHVCSTDEGKTITVAVTDRCVGCEYTALDFSPSAYNVLADPVLGRIHNLKWSFV